MTSCRSDQHQYVNRHQACPSVVVHHPCPCRSGGRVENGKPSPDGRDVRSLLANACCLAPLHHEPNPRWLEQLPRMEYTRDSLNPDLHLKQ